MRRALIVGAGVACAVLAFVVTRDATRLVGHTGIGTITNGVVGRDALMRSRNALQPYDHVRSYRDDEGNWKPFIAGVG